MKLTDKGCFDMDHFDSCMTCNHKYCAKKVSLFASFSDTDLSKVLTLIERQHYEKGQTIFNEGEPCDRLLIVNGGSLKVFRYSKDGKEQILYVLGDGDFLGDLNLLKKDIYSFSAMALEETHLCTIKKDDFDQLMKFYPELFSRVLEYAHDRINTLENLVQTLTAKDVETRLAILLIRLSEAFGVEKPEGIEIQLPLTREEMANFVGLTRETVSRKLSSLQSEGLIELNDNRTILLKDFKSIKERSML